MYPIKFRNTDTAGKMEGVEKSFKASTDTGFLPELIAEPEKQCEKRVIGRSACAQK